MSVQKRGDKWLTRWEDGSGHRQRTFTSKELADAFDRRMKDLKALGPALAGEFDRQDVTWGQYTGPDGPWRDHASTFKKPTRDKYRSYLDGWLAELDNEPMIAITTERMRKVVTHMNERDASPKTVREVLAKAAAIFETAIPEYAQRNPVKAVRRPPVIDDDEINIAQPAELEALIDRLTGRDRAIAILGGRAGLSPKEIWLLQCGDFDGERLTIHKSRTKDSRAHTRYVELDRLSRQQLKEWLLQSGRRGKVEIVGGLTVEQRRKWHRHHLPHGMRLTDLRHSHASALHHTLMTLPAILDRLGHGQQAHWKHYAHVVRSIRPEQRYPDLEALYAAARQTASAQPVRNSGVKT